VWPVGQPAHAGGKRRRRDHLQADRPDAIKDPRPGRPQIWAHPEVLIHQAQDGELMDQLAGADGDQGPVVPVLVAGAWSRNG
jgi:hypothetical protein